jgi:hypothetical protein
MTIGVRVPKVYKYKKSMNASLSMDPCNLKVCRSQTYCACLHHFKVTADMVC